MATSLRPCGHPASASLRLRGPRLTFLGSRTTQRGLFSCHVSEPRRTPQRVAAIGGGGGLGDLAGLRGDLPGAEKAPKKKAATKKKKTDGPVSDASIKKQQVVRVQATRGGRGGKTVTVVRGLQEDAKELKAILKKLKGVCGTGGTVKDGNIEIQGELADRVVEALIKQGYTNTKKAGGK